MDCNKKYMKAAQCHASMLKIEPQAFGIASMFFKVDGEICWWPTYFDNSQYLILTMYPISWASCEKVYNPVSSGIYLLLAVCLHQLWSYLSSQTLLDHTVIMWLQQSDFCPAQEICLKHGQPFECLRMFFTVFL